MSFITSCFLFLAVQYCQVGNYEDAYGILVSINTNHISKEDYNKYYFYSAVAAHQTLRKQEALTNLKYLQNSFQPIPRRYANLALAIENDLENWQSTGLEDIERRMNEVANRVNNGQIGEKTQEKQRKIIFRLDELIKEQENAAKIKIDQDPDSLSNKKNNSNNSNSPAADSSLMGGEAKGKIDEKRLRYISEQWGMLTPQERAKAVADLQMEIPAKYKPYVDEYFKSLNRNK